MLSDEEKARIRAEEEFRKAIQQQLATQDPPQTKWQRLFAMLNTNVGGWLLSTVLVGIAGLVATAVHDKWTEAERKASETRQRSHQEADMVTRLLPSLAKTGDAPEHLIAVSVVGHLANKGSIDSALVAALQPVIEKIAKNGVALTASPQEREAAETVAAILDASPRAHTLQQSGDTTTTPTAPKPIGARISCKA